MTWVESLDDFENFLPHLVDLKTNIPELALDCEASRGLDRNGNITHLTISVFSLNHTWIICIRQLPDNLFEIEGPTGQTLKSVLENEHILQLWWDVRSDPDALFGLYRIRLANVRDVQLMELAARVSYPRTWIGRLEECVRIDGLNFMSPVLYQDWLQKKRDGKNYFKDH